MTTYYVDSAAGSNTSPYDTWAKAATFIGTVLAIPPAGGSTIYVASTHNESTAGAVSWTMSNTNPSAPGKIICADKTSGAPPSTIATGGTVNVTGDNALSINIDYCYLYGLTFKVGKTSSVAAIDSSLSGGQYYESCSFQLTGSSGAAFIKPGANIFDNCTLKFAAVGQYLAMGFALWNGGSLLSGGTSPTALLGGPGGAAGANSNTPVLANFDLTAASAAIDLVGKDEGSSFGVASILQNVALPASWSGALRSLVPKWGCTTSLVNCDSTGSNYVYHLATQFGDIRSETTIVRSGGASDGTTPLSWKMVSLSTAGIFPITPLQTESFVIWNDSTSSKTVTVEFLHDSVTGLKNNEIWLEVSYMGASGSPLGSVASSAPADVFATATTCTSSSATWTTTGMTNPNKQKMSVTFTPQLKGLLIATVKLAKASYTVYVDPLMT